MKREENAQSDTRKCYFFSLIFFLFFQLFDFNSKFRAINVQPNLHYFWYRFAIHEIKAEKTKRKKKKRKTLIFLIRDDDRNVFCLAFFLFFYCLVAIFSLRSFYFVVFVFLFLSRSILFSINTNKKEIESKCKSSQ